MNPTSTSIESLVFGASEWTLPAILLGLCLSFLAGWSYLFRNEMTGIRWLAMALKIAAVAALAFCLLEPLRRVERPRPGANVMAVLVDNSRSMEIKSNASAVSRSEFLAPKLQTETAWQSRLAQDFDVRRYAFDDRLRSVDDLAALDFQGSSSSLAAALTTLQQRFENRPVAGVLMFSDGLATDDVESLLAQSWPFPIYPVAQAADERLRDLSVTDTSVTLSSFELAPAGIEATVKASGLAGEELVVRLLDDQGETLERQILACDSDPFERKVRFQFRPTEPGFQLVSVRAMLRSDDREEGELRSRREVTLANNTRLIAVDRGGGPYRILYVAGRPNWEFKFIRRALEEDIEIDLHGLVRIAKKEPKFSFRDRGVDTANPLLAGFDGDEETAEQYDEPVLLRLGVDEDELKAGFPSGEEDLFTYHAIILDDVEASFFSQQQMLLMRRFVAERGGGLMMLGGQESFLGGGYSETPLGDVLPVYLRGSEKALSKDGFVRYQLTREGSLEPWLRLRDNEAQDRERVQQMPDFQTWNSVADVKPGASILAELETTSSKQPGLVAQRFGSGRSLALLVGDFWRWSMRRATEETDDLAQSWRQIARWLTSDVPQRIEVRTQSPSSPLEPHVVRIELRDPAFKPLDNAEISLSVTEPDGQQVQMGASPDPIKAGSYVAEYWSRLDGGYVCEVTATGPDGEFLGTRTQGWTAEPSAVEFARVEANNKLLEQLAEKSGGELVSAEDLESFVAALPSKKVPITEARVEPLWHRPWILLFAITCLCAEWAIRRWKGLP